MADMDTVVLVNTLASEEGGEYLACTLGPQGHLLSRNELEAMCRKAIADVEAEDIDLAY